MRLNDIIRGIYERPVAPGFAECSISAVSCDSRAAVPGCLFIAVSGTQLDGNDFIKDAVAKGAVAVAKAGAGRTVKGFTIPDSVCVLDVAEPREFLKKVTLRFYGNPSAKVRVIGVTGTNGKTTITYLLEAILCAGRKSCGVVGTVNYRIAGRVLPSKNTTPGLVENQKLLAELAGQSIDYCVMEVSSHALHQGRVDLIDFRAGVFTNLTGDHLDYHGTMENYFRAKALLFEHLKSDAMAVINTDDTYGQLLTGRTPARVVTYGVRSTADVRAVDIRFDFSGSRMTIIFPDGKISLKTRLIGQHNVYNILAAAAAAWGEGLDPAAIRTGIETVGIIPGRLEAVDAGQDFFVFIDYAHTEDGLSNVLTCLRSVGTAKIIVVFGCGGDRDRTKRPKMGRVAGRLADHAIVTTDNARSEAPQAIIEEILPGFERRNYEVIVDRTEAIRRALTMARTGDVVLLAGKGHETYQILKDRTIDFDERVIVREALKG